MYWYIYLVYIYIPHLFLVISRYLLATVVLIGFNVVALLCVCVFLLNTAATPYCQLEFQMSSHNSKVSRGPKSYTVARKGGTHIQGLEFTVLLFGRIIFYIDHIAIKMRKMCNNSAAVNTAGKKI